MNVVAQFSESAHGIVVRGHRVASGLAGDARFPGGTIALQLPFLRAAIPDFDRYLERPAFAGTVNIAFSERSTLLRPDAVVRAVRWTTEFPPENFMLSRCVLRYDCTDYAGWIYLPDPATKPDHLQEASIVEVLASRLPGLRYGDSIELRSPPGTLQFALGDTSNQVDRSPKA